MVILNGWIGFGLSPTISDLAAMPSAIQLLNILPKLAHLVSVLSVFESGIVSPASETFMIHAPSATIQNRAIIGVVQPPTFGTAFDIPRPEVEARRSNQAS